MGAYSRPCPAGHPDPGRLPLPRRVRLRGVQLHLHLVFTNPTPTDAYRGAGRPEATYATERIMDALARRARQGPGRGPGDELHPALDQSPTTPSARLTVRLRQLHGHARQGQEAGRLRRAAGASRPSDGRRGDTQAARRRDLQLLEVCGWAPSQVLARPPLRRRRLGASIDPLHAHRQGHAVIGTSPHGQGHETTFSQIVADELGVDPRRRRGAARRHLGGDLGLDSYGSRSLSVGGVTIQKAAERVREKARVLAAHELEVAEDDLEWTRGTFPVKGADRGQDHPRAGLRRLGGPQPARGRRPGPGRRRHLRPAQLDLPVRGPHLRGRGRPGDRVDPDRQVRGRGRLRHHINPMIVDGQVTAASPRASPRRCTRRRSTTRTAPC